MNLDQIRIIKTIAKGSSVVFLGMLIGKLLHFPTSILLARYFGASDYGLFSIAIALSSVVASISVLGMGMGITRFLPYYKQRNALGELKATLRFGAKTILLCSLCCATVLFFNASWLAEKVFKNPDLAILIRIASVSIPVVALLQFIKGIFRGLKKLHYILYCKDITRPILQFILLLSIALAGLSVSYAVLAHVVVSFLVLGLAFWILARDTIFTKLQEVEPKRNVRDFILHSYPLAITTLVRFARHRFDLLVIGFFLNAADAGIYNIAITLALLLTLPLTGINRILLPVASELFSKGAQEELANTYKTMSRWGLTVILPIYILIMFFSEEFIQFFYGPEYVSAANALRIAALGVTANVSLGSFGEYLQALGKSKVVMSIAVIGSVLNIGCLLLLVPVYGINGAALSFAVSLIVMNLIGLFALAGYKNIHPFSKAYVGVLSTGITLYTLSFVFLKTIFSSSINIYWIGFCFFLVTIIYSLILYTRNFISNDEKIILISAIKKYVFR